MIDSNRPRPLASHSANYVNMVLTREGADWVYRPTTLTRFFIKFVKFLGYLALISSVFAIMANPLAMLFAASAGGLFIFLGYRIDRQYGQGAHFDTRKRMITVLREPLFNQSLKMLDLKTESLPFERVRSLQILQKRARMNSRPKAFISYELNLVLDNGKRLNIADHNDIGQIREDARTLSTYLSVKVEEILNA